MSEAKLSAIDLPKANRPRRHQSAGRRRTRVGADKRAPRMKDRHDESYHNDHMKGGMQMGSWTQHQQMHLEEEREQDGRKDNPNVRSGGSSGKREHGRNIDRDTINPSCLPPLCRASPPSPPEHRPPALHARRVPATRSPDTTPATGGARDGRQPTPTQHNVVQANDGSHSLNFSNFSQLRLRCVPLSFPTFPHLCLILPFKRPSRSLP